MRIRLERDVASAALRSLPATLVWLSAAVAVLGTLPSQAWQLKSAGLVAAVGVVGMWRYSWQLLNAVRAYWYGLVHYPRLRADADADPEPYPPRLFVVVASYKEDADVTHVCFSTLAAELRGVPRAVVYVSVGDPDHAPQIADLMAGHDVRFTLQKDGKRRALGHALRLIAAERPGPDDLVVLMDGDSGLGEGVVRKCVSLFKRDARLGAVTADNVPVVFDGCPDLLRAWYELKMARRHHMMMSHALGRRVMTLTGRFSVYRALPCVQPGFIGALEQDRIWSWPQGVVKFLMGDDKSTMFQLLKGGWDTLYVPDGFIVCLENRSGPFLKTARSLMFRWYGNMLRTNGRSLALGVGRLPAFAWLCFLDQRLSMWTALVGPASAVAMGLAVSVYYLWFYVAWVILTRLVSLWMTAVVYGHELKVIDVPLVVFEQWWGAATKVYCLFHLDRQSWSKAGAKHTQKSSGDSRLPKALMAACVLAFALGVGLLTGVLRLPPVF